jgi:type VI protein secretion system component VasK
MKTSPDGAKGREKWKRWLSILVIALALGFMLAVVAGRVQDAAHKSQDFWERIKIERAQRVERVETLQRQAQETSEARKSK